MVTISDFFSQCSFFRSGKLLALRCAIRLSQSLFLFAGYALVIF
jgi:hypothetical protein